MIVALSQRFDGGRCKFPRDKADWLRAFAGCALLSAGGLAGHLVGLVDTEGAAMDVAAVSSVWPTLETESAIELPPEFLRGFVLPKADRMAIANWHARPSKAPPRPDVAGSPLPIAPPRGPDIAEAPRTSVAATEGPLSTLPPSRKLVTTLPLATLPPIGDPRTSRPIDRPRIAIVIDDLGLLQKATKKMIALNPGLTLAFLPYGRKSGALAADAHAAGHEVLLHMPMEPDSRADPGPEALLTTLRAGLIRTRLSHAFDRIPQAIGLNNHMGSRFTSDADAMAVVLDELYARDMMVLDSVTTPHSVISDLARARGVPSDARDVFLDNDRDVALINQQLDELERIARAVGSAVAIGHPYKETITALREWLPGAYQRGLRLVPLSQLAQPSPAHPMVAANLPDTVYPVR